MNRRQTIVAALAAVALVALSIVIFSRSEPEEGESPAADTASEDEVESDEPPPVPPSSTPSAAPEEPSEPPQAPPATAQPLAPTHPLEPVADAGPLDPVIADHAKKIIVPNAIMAIDRRDSKALYMLLQFAREHSEEKLVSEADIGAIEAAIACLERAPDAREEAEDLLRFGAPTELSDALKKACSAK